MPRASSICLRDGCLEIATVRGYCKRDAPAPWAGSKRNLNRPTNWNSLRAQARTREPTCRMCGNLGAVVDHIRAIARGGSWELSNLQVLCKSCHASKTREESRGLP